MKHISKLLVASLMSLCNYESQAQVSVSCGNTVANAVSYTTLKDAFDAINAGKHKGNITISLYGSTKEYAPAVLNSGDIAPASYSAVDIRAIADHISVRRAAQAGEAVIILNGADNVSIEGNDPRSPETKRDLSIINTSPAAVANTGCIRIIASAPGSTADNIQLKNLILTGNATGRNTPAATDTEGSEATSFGIYAGGEVSDAIPGGATINNLVIHNNQVNACAMGIAFNGSSPASSNGVIISDNVIGAAARLQGVAPFSAPATTVYAKGIYVNGTNAVSVIDNTIQNIISYAPVPVHGIELAGGIGRGIIQIKGNNITGIINNGDNATAPKAILVSSAGAPYSLAGNIISNVQWKGGSTSPLQIVSGIYVHTNAPSATIENNQVSKIYNLNPDTYGAAGISLNAGNNIFVQNNVVVDVLNNISGGSAFSTQYGCYGIRFMAGSGHKVTSNMVHLSGQLMGKDAAAILTAALVIGGAAQSGMEVRNNIFSNTITGGSGAVAHVAVYMPTAGSELNLMMNNNVYYSGTGQHHGIAQTGLTAGTGLYAASNFDPSADKPSADNFITYTQAAGNTENDNSSSATSNMDLLHQNTNLALPAEQLRLLQRERRIN